MALVAERLERTSRRHRFNTLRGAVLHEMDMLALESAENRGRSTSKLVYSHVNV
jgi:hypothetical protein